MEKTLIGHATDEQVAKWKKEHTQGAFTLIADGRIAYFKKPGFAEIDCFYAKAETRKNVSDDWKELAGLLFLGGDKKLIESPAYLPAINAALNKQIVGVQVEVGNL